MRKLSDGSELVFNGKEFLSERKKKMKMKQRNVSEK